MTTSTTPAPAEAARLAPFLAPPTPEEETPAPRTSDHDEATMRRLRDPFTTGTA